MSNGEIGSITSLREGSGPKLWAENNWYTDNVSSYPSSLQTFNDIQNCVKAFIQTSNVPKKPTLKPDQFYEASLLPPMGMH